MPGNASPASMALLRSGRVPASHQRCCARPPCAGLTQARACLARSWGRARHRRCSRSVAHSCNGVVTASTSPATPPHSVPVLRRTAATVAQIRWRDERAWSLRHGGPCSRFHEWSVLWGARAVCTRSVSVFVVSVCLDGRGRPGRFQVTPRARSRRSKMGTASV